jgi:hypothetical protein
MTEQDALAAWTEAKEVLTILQDTPCPADVVFAVEYCGYLQAAAAHERVAGRAYLAARDRAVAAQVTCSDQEPGVADFEGDQR